MGELILCLDAGTSSMRGGLLDRRGRLHFLHQVPYRVDSGPGGRVEMDPHVWTGALEQIAARAGAWCREHGARLEAVSLTSQRSSLIPVDAEGNPLRSAIMWQDRRTAPLCEEINNRADTYEICGMRADPVYTAPKILWLKENQPELYQEARFFIGVHELLLHRLTGRFVTDHAVASRSCLLDICSLDWSDALLELFQVPRTKLAELVEPGSVCGTLTGELATLLGCEAGTAVVSAGGDQQCAALGQGLVRPGAFSVNCGTGAYVLGLSRQPVYDPGRQIRCNAAAIPGHWVMEASAMAAGGVYDWAWRLWGCASAAMADEEAGQAPPGAGGLLLLPHLMGRAFPTPDPHARGTFAGLAMHTGRPELMRATLEGVAAELADCVDAVAALAGAPEELRCAGGLTRGALFRQILAGMVGRPIRSGGSGEATLLGAWANAALALGHYQSHGEALEATDTGDLRIDQPVPEHQEIYRRQRQARRLLEQQTDAEAMARLLAAPEPRDRPIEEGTQ